MEAETPRPMTFSLEASECVRYLRDYDRLANPAKIFQRFGIAIVSLPELITAFGRWGHTAHLGRPALDFLLAAVAVSTMLLFVLSSRLGLALRARKQSKNLTLDFEQAGIGLERDGDFQRVAWYVIKEAFDLPTAIAITRRDDLAHPIFIPKRALDDDGAQLWSFLERRLTGSRPSIRDLGFTAPKRLINSIDQLSSTAAYRS